MAERHEPEPPPRGLAELLTLLAVLLVLVPEWMAYQAMASFQHNQAGSDLPVPSAAWRRIPELRLALLNLAQLRQLARQERIWGYSNQNREQLTAQLLKRLKKRSPSTNSLW